MKLLSGLYFFFWFDVLLIILENDVIVSVILFKEIKIIEWECFCFCIYDCIKRRLYKILCM